MPTRNSRVDRQRAVSPLFFRHRVLIRCNASNETHPVFSYRSPLPASTLPSLVRPLRSVVQAHFLPTNCASLERHSTKTPRQRWREAEHTANTGSYTEGAIFSGVTSVEAKMKKGTTYPAVQSEPGTIRPFTSISRGSWIEEF